MMVGREVKNVFPKTECEIGEEVFRVEGLTGNGFENISFEVRKGEILGLTGLAEAGRRRDYAGDFWTGSTGVRKNLYGRKGDYE